MGSPEKQMESESTGLNNGKMNQIGDTFKPTEEIENGYESAQNNQENLREEASSDSSFFTDLDSDEEK